VRQAHRGERCEQGAPARRCGIEPIAQLIEAALEAPSDRARRLTQAARDLGRREVLDVAQHDRGADRRLEREHTLGERASKLEASDRGLWIDRRVGPLCLRRVLAGRAPLAGSPAHTRGVARDRAQARPERPIHVRRRAHRGEHGLLREIIGVRRIGGQAAREPAQPRVAASCGEVHSATPDAGDQLIVDNYITGNHLGLGFINGGAGAKVENNVIIGNQLGVEDDSPSDMGGGPTGSAGGNTFVLQNDRRPLGHLGGHHRRAQQLLGPLAAHHRHQRDEWDRHPPRRLDHPQPHRYATTSSPCP
jgi:hypothetical protein